MTPRTNAYRVKHLVVFEVTYIESMFLAIPRFASTCRASALDATGGAPQLIAHRLTGGTDREIYHRQAIHRRRRA
jgi:hypothetical protein